MLERKHSYLKYIFWGVAVMLPGEFLVQALVHKNLTYFFSAVILYALLLSLGYGLWKVSSGVIKNPKVELIAFSIFWGLVGLFLIEWAILGNTPQGNPEAFQLSMFAWWVGVFLFPRLFLEGGRYNLLKVSFLSYHFFSSALFLFFGLAIEPLAGALVFSYALIIWLILEIWYIVKKFRSD